MKVNRFPFSPHIYLPTLMLSLASLVSVGMVVLQAFRVDESHAGHLIFNLGIAWVPYWLALGAYVWQTYWPQRKIGLLGMIGLWFIFFPNAPYIITDFVHLGQRYHLPFWYEILMLQSFALTGLLLGMTSLFYMQRIVTARRSPRAGWLFALISLIACSGGVYIGRFLRWNSWDLLHRPFEVLLAVGHTFANPVGYIRPYAFSILFAAFLIVSYLFLVSWINLMADSRPLAVPENKNMSSLT